MYKLFEERVLNATSEYYSKDGESAMQKFYVEGKSFVDYMKYIKNRLTDEIKRTKMLHPSTETPLMQLCYKILIEKHLETFDAEFKVSDFYFKEEFYPRNLLNYLILFGSFYVIDLLESHSIG